MCNLIKFQYWNLRKQLSYEFDFKVIIIIVIREQNRIHPLNLLIDHCYYFIIQVVIGLHFIIQNIIITLQIIITIIIDQNLHINLKYQFLLLIIITIIDFDFKYCC